MLFSRICLAIVNLSTLCMTSASEIRGMAKSGAVPLLSHLSEHQVPALIPKRDSPMTIVPDSDGHAYSRFFQFIIHFICLNIVEYFDYVSKVINN